MSKFEIIQALEGKLIPTPSGKWHRVINGKYHTGYGWANLRLFEIGYLEKLYLVAKETEDE